MYNKLYRRNIFLKFFAIELGTKISDYDKIKVILVDKDRMVDGKLWIDELINSFSKADYEN